MSDTKIIRNTTGVAQSVVFQGRQIVLQPYGEERMETVLADVFLQRCSPIVEELPASIETVYDPEGDETIWIANVTGHPQYPKRVPAKVLQNKKWVHTEVDNPAAKIYPVIREYDAGMQPYVGRDGAYLTKNFPKVALVVPPFKRVPFKKEVGAWFLRREGVSSRLSGTNPAVIKSRKPLSYEPDMDWSLDEMRAFLSIISAEKEDTGPSEADLAKKVTAEKLPREQALSLLQAAKKALKDTVWYYVVDPKYRAPTRSEVRELLTGKSAEEIHDAQLDKLMGAKSVAAGASA